MNIIAVSVQVRPDLLTCWKDIAHYLGKGVRTVQRYEVELGLPVRRPAGKSRGSVLATCRELDAWIARSPLKTSHSLWREGTFSSELSILRDSVSETRKLRKEAQALRSETQECVALLHQNLDRLREQLTPRNEIPLQALHGA